jgi:hypothetical protein
LLKNEIETAGDKLYKLLDSEKESIETAIPEYIINGEITYSNTDSNTTTYQIWGTSFPMPFNDTTMGSNGYRNVKSHITVLVSNSLKTDTIRRNGVNILINGGVYYIGQDFGKNQAGQSVPIFIYGNNMALVHGAGNRKQRLDTLKIQLAAVSEMHKKFSAELQ